MKMGKIQRKFGIKMWKLKKVTEFQKKYWVIKIAKMSEKFKNWRQNFKYLKIG